MDINNIVLQKPRQELDISKLKEGDKVTLITSMDCYKIRPIEKSFIVINPATGELQPISTNIAINQEYYIQEKIEVGRRFWTLNCHKTGHQSLSGYVIKINVQKGGKKMSEKNEERKIGKV